MSEIKCIDAERIGDVLEYPPDHPVRRHTETCPRCRTLVGHYLAFLQAEAREDAGLDAARSELDAAIARFARPPAAAKPASPFRVRRGGWPAALLRPMPALALVAVVAVAAVLVTRNQRGIEAPLLRSGAGAPAVWQLDSPALRRDGTVVLSWAPVESADAYQVRIYGPELEIFATLGPVRGTTIELTRAGLPPSVPANTDLTWRVVAMRAGSELTVSGPRSVRIP